MPTPDELVTRRAAGVEIAATRPEGVEG